MDQEKREELVSGHRITEKCAHINQLWKLYLEREMSGFGIYQSQCRILMYIAAHPDASQKEIALAQRVSTATIAVVLKKLENGGYISREASEEDSRFNRIRVTKKGREVADGSRRVYLHMEEAQFQGFTEEEFRVLDGFLDRIRLNTEYLFQEKGISW